MVNKKFRIIDFDTSLEFEKVETEENMYDNLLFISLSINNETDGLVLNYEEVEVLIEFLKEEFNF